MNFAFGINSPSFDACAQHGPAACTKANLKAANEFGSSMIRDVRRFAKPQDGYFIDSCWTHCFYDDDEAWATFHTNQMIARVAVETWWRSNFTQAPRIVDCMLSMNANCNPACDDLVIFYNKTLPSRM